MLLLMWLEKPTVYYTLNLGELVPWHTFPPIYLVLPMAAPPEAGATLHWASAG